MSEKVNHEFNYEGSDFLLDGEPFLILSGEMHYQRIPHAYWRQRLQMAKAMGLNTVAIYMFWNGHEPKPGEFDFTGRNDVKEFVKIAQEEKLWVLIRPGPYCCAEWDFGGLPPWLLKHEDIRVRSMDSRYLEVAERYIRRWAEELVPLQCNRGGPILMVQVENEYGSYGSDKTYLRRIRDLLLEVGFEVPLFTVDGPSEFHLDGGTLPDVLAGVNFGAAPQLSYRHLDKIRGIYPKLCGEYYPGWFNHWGDWKLVNTNAARIVIITKELEYMINHKISWNLYMFHGGTNFGFSAGANYTKKYQPDITSYDYSAPLNECGHPTKQFHAYRKLLTKYSTNLDQIPEIPALPSQITIGPIQFSESAALLDNLPEPIISSQIHSMEHYGQNYGHILYRTILPKSYTGKTLKIHKLHDYAHIFLDGKRIATLNRSDNPQGLVSFKVPKIHKKNARLDILVEGHGRINFAVYLLDPKGITDFVSIGDGTIVMNWEIYPIPLDTEYLKNVEYTAKSDTYGQSKPQFHKGTFTLNEIGDTFLDCQLYKKGMVWVNGHNLGRFWGIGPQKSLYVPGPWVKVGENEIVLLDMEGISSTKVLKKVKKQWKKQLGTNITSNPNRPPVCGLKLPQ